MNDRPLRFLADESCYFAFVRALRQVGYDVTTIVEFMSRAPDLKVLESAFEEGRILLTEDKDWRVGICPQAGNGWYPFGSLSSKFAGTNNSGDG